MDATMMQCIFTLAFGNNKWERTVPRIYATENVLPNAQVSCRREGRASVLARGRHNEEGEHFWLLLLFGEVRYYSILHRSKTARRINPPLFLG